MVNGAFDKIYEKEPDAILNMAVTHRFEYAYKR